MLKVKVYSMSADEIRTYLNKYNAKLVKVLNDGSTNIKSKYMYYLLDNKGRLYITAKSHNGVKDD